MPRSTCFHERSDTTVCSVDGINVCTNLDQIFHLEKGLWYRRKQNNAPSTRQCVGCTTRTTTSAPHQAAVCRSDLPPDEGLLSLICSIVFGPFTRKNARSIAMLPSLAALKGPPSYLRISCQIEPWSCATLSYIPMTLDHVDRLAYLDTNSLAVFRSIFSKSSSSSPCKSVRIQVSYLLKTRSANSPSNLLNFFR